MRGYAVGAARAMLWTAEPSGTYKGRLQGTGTSLANNSVGAALVLWDIRSANLAAVPVTNVDIEGGDRIVAQVAFGGGKTAPFEIISSSLDTDVNTLVSKSTPNTTNSLLTYASPNYNLSTPRVLGCAVQQRYETSQGDSYYLTRVFPAGSGIISVGQAAYRAPTDVSVNFSPINTTKGIDGRSFGTGGLNLGLQNDTADQYWLFSPYPMHFLMYRGDGTETTFNTIYKPVSTTITLNATVNEMVKNGTPTALASLTLAGLGTLAAAGNAGDGHFLAYGTDFVPV